MKTKITFTPGTTKLLLLLLLSLAPSALLAQGTAFTYQGSLNDGANRASGVYDLQFSIFDAGSGNSLVAGPVTNSAVAVSNGLFTAMLDFGPGVFTGPPRWLEISVRSNGIVSFSTLTPRQLFTPTPYAITASNLTGTLPASQLSGALASSQVSGTYNSAVNFNNPADQFSGSFFGTFSGTTFTGGNFVGHFIGDGSGLTGVTATNASALGGLGPNSFWQTTGNSNIIAGVNYLGTADTNAFELRVGNIRALRIEPDPRGSSIANLIGGSPENRVMGPSAGGGNLIGGGGFLGGPNVIRTNSSGDFIGAGSANTIGDNVFDSVITGGQGNAILSSDSVIAGGLGNTVTANTNTFPSYSVIGGGYGNTADASGSVIAGGYFNTNRGYEGSIGGGYINIVNTNYATIAGGVFNEAGGIGSFLGGGGYDGFNVFGNQVDGGGSAIVGGLGNNIQSSATESFIGGGYQNLIQSNSYEAVIGGGQNNTLGLNSAYSVIAGGVNNSIGVNSAYSVIGGGSGNLILSNATDSVIGGGTHNTNFSNEAIIGGGQNNLIYSSSFQSIIASGAANIIGSNAFETTISGGALNSISNFATYATIGGGYQNTASDLAATVPGGYGNTAFGAYSFAAGRQAKALNFGTFVWADSGGSDFVSTGPNQFLIRSGGGVGINKNNPATALDVNGTVTAAAFNSTGTGFSGSGSSLTGLNASQLTTGTLPSSALSGTYANALTFNNAGNSFTGNGSGLTSLNASQLTSGTLPSSALSGTYSGALNFNNAANSFTGNGSGLTSLNASQLGSGTVPDARLSANVAFLNRNQTFTGTNTFVTGLGAASRLTVYGTSGIDTSKFTGLGFQYYTGSGEGAIMSSYDDGVGFITFYTKPSFLQPIAQRMIIGTTGNVGIGNVNPTNLLMVANARCDGSTWINASDRNLKENFSPIDPEQILTKVAALPLTQWNYKSDAGHPHLGPVAQDFYAQFSLGADNKSITTVDEGGVALAAIQGLNHKVEVQATELKEKDARIAALEKAVNELRTLMTQRRNGE